MKQRTTMVRAAEGLVLPVPRGVCVKAAPQFFPTADPIEVIADHYFIRRRIKSGDLIEVKARPKKTGSPNRTTSKPRSEKKSEG